jgi:iron-sulfur cluster insertion protein
MELNITDAAAVRILKLREIENDQDLALRIQVLGGGCSGFQYTFSLEKVTNADDIVFHKNDATVVIDDASLTIIQGSQLDYVDELAASMFVIKNPNASSKCGCGNSFSI